jgi:hypothetical protein
VCSVYDGTVIEREHIISEIRRTAAENGGTALGKGRFEKATGIRESDWAGRYWARWGDALEQAGLACNRLNAKRDDDEILSLLAVEVRRNGRWPTTHELQLRKREDPTLPIRRSLNASARVPCEWGGLWRIARSTRT